MPNSQQHICALIPTYNNAGTIVDVVNRVHAQLRDIIVVVDGSTDDTLARLQTLAFSITIVSYEKNRGKGGALVAGFRKAIEMGFDYALTIDADGQHYPEDIPLLRHSLDVHPGALIVGSRKFDDDNMPGKSKFANRFSNFWFRVQTTIDLPDTQTGMRIYPLDKLYGLNLLTSRYEAELELLVFAAWRNVQLIPVPIRVYYPPKEERVSHFRPVRDFTRISILNCFLCLGALLFGYINMYWRTVLCFGYFGSTMLFIISPLTLIYFAIHGNNKDSRARYHRHMQRLAQQYRFMLSGLYWHVNNPYKVNLGEHPAIIVSNHQSLIDIMLYLSLSPKIIVMMKNAIWNNPIYAVVARYMDCFSPSWDEEKIVEHLRRVTAEGYCPLFFPEGTRTLTGDVGRFHRGAFYYADLLKLPIQPLLIEGMNDYISKRQFAIKPNQVYLNILPEIPYGDTSFGHNYKRMSKSLEMHYDAFMHSNRIHVGILGAGVSGLFTGALLAQRGYIVTLLEQLPVFGGGLYSYERDGETWATGMHILSGMQPDGPVNNVLKQLGITADCVPTTLDASPATLIGEREWAESSNGVYRFVGGSQALADELALYITRHGGRVLTSQRVTALSQHEGRFVVKTAMAEFSFDKIVSSLHPKQLLAISQLPIYRPATVKRILSTPETFGSFKTYIRLKPKSLNYDPVTHFISDYNLLVMTPCSEHNQVYARTIETVMPLDYSELKPWHNDRKAHYADYEAYKKRKEQEVIAIVESLYPNLSKHIESVFSSTSLTYRDDYLSPEGAMYGMSESVGSIHTRVDGLFVTGQNVFLHGLCGVVMTSLQVAESICEA